MELQVNTARCKHDMCVWGVVSEPYTIVAVFYSKTNSTSLLSVVLRRVRNNTSVALRNINYSFLCVFSLN